MKAKYVAVMFFQLIIFCNKDVLDYKIIYFY